MRIANKWGGACCLCGIWVPEGIGWTDSENDPYGWRVRHLNEASCEAAKAALRQRVLESQETTR